MQSEKPTSQSYTLQVDDSSSAQQWDVSFFSKWWRRIFKSASVRDAERQIRLQQLSTMIDVYPDSSANYLLRGELFLQDKHCHLAEADFQQALVLATEQLDQDPWGIASQAIIDRATRGLEQAQRFASVHQVDTQAHIEE